MGALAPAAPAAPASDRAYSGSSWGLYSFLMTNIMNGLDQINGGADRHPTEKFGGVMLSALPLAILLFPLQMIAEAEVRLLDRLGV